MWKFFTIHPFLKNYDTDDGDNIIKKSWRRTESGERYFLRPDSGQLELIKNTGHFKRRSSEGECTKFAW